MTQSEVRPGTVVFLFALRFHDEPADAATRCRLIAAPVRWTDGEMLDGIQVDVTKLPPGTRYVRFYGAW